MRKHFGRKNFLKEAGVLLIAAILVLASLVIVPMTIAQMLDHDVGVTAIISPITGPYQSYPVEVTIENFGTSSESMVNVNVVIEKDGAKEYDQTVTIGYIEPGTSLNVILPDWTPAAETGGMYEVTACTQLIGDENTSNDCLTKAFYIVIDFMGLGVTPLGLAELTINVGILNVYNCVSGLNDTDGVFANLENTYNQWGCDIENPFRNKSISSFTCAAVSGGPYIQTISNMEDNGIIGPMTDLSMNISIENISASPPFTVLGMNNSVKNGMNLVFYKEHIMTVDGYLKYGYTKVECEYLGYELGNQLSFGITYSSPVQWTWSEQGVNNLSVNAIIVIPEISNISSPLYQDSCIYANNITEFNITQMNADVNNPPSTPNIDGPANGKILTKYDYKIRNTGIEPLYYFVDWGDDSEISFVGPFSPGTEATVSHTWLKKGTYTIKAKAMDVQYSESDWGTLDVTMPRTRIIIIPFFSELFERFPHAFPILRHLMGIY